MRWQELLDEEGPAVLAPLWQAWRRGQCYLVENPHASKVAISLESFPAGPGIVLYSSGSTGLPQPVYLSFEQLILAARAANEFYQITAADRWLLALPLFHVSGLMIPLRTTLAGASCVQATSRDLRLALRETTPTVVSLVPTQLQELVQDPTLWEQLRAMKAIICGGAACSEALWCECQRLALPVSFSYGMTETAAMLAATAPGAYIWPLRLTVFSHVEVEAVAGLLRVRLRLATSQWLATQDQVELSADARVLTMQGRADQQFKCGGELISPREIVEILMRLDHVGADYAVWPAPDLRLGAVPMLMVWSATQPEPLALVEALRRALPKFKCPRAIYWAKPCAAVGTLFKPTAGAAALLVQTAAATELWP